MALRALFLDFGGTLIREVPSRFEIYARAAREAGASVSTEEMHELMTRAHRELPREIEGAFRYSDHWFRAFIDRIFTGYLGLEFADRRQFQEGLFQVFSDAATFRLFPGALELLQEARVQGLRVGIVSNWSPRLVRLLDSLELSPLLDFALCSAVEQLEKPDPALFRRALELAGVAAREALHAGNDPLKDVRGAQAAALRAVLVDHSGTMLTPEEAPRVTSLYELRDLLTRD